MGVHGSRHLADKPLLFSSWRGSSHLLMCFSHFSPLETISTSSSASLYHHLPILSVFSDVSCQVVFGHIFTVVVCPSQSRSPLLLFPITTMSFIYLDMLSSSLLLTCAYQCNLFCLGMLTFGTRWHSLVLSGF